MKQVPIEQAVGLTICHDITEIIVGEAKRVAFKRGHVVRPEDIDHLLRIGKEHLYVWTDQPAGLVHEDEAAERLAKALSGPGVVFGEPKEGRINLKATYQGLVVIDLDLLNAVNSVPEVTVAVTHTLREVASGGLLAGTRVIPLCVVEESVAKVEKLCSINGPLVKVEPFRHLKVGLVTTGSEVYRGRIKDAFGPVLRAKFSAWGSEVITQILTPDDQSATMDAIMKAIDEGAELVTASGGMSVDPDDKTPGAIRAVCDEVISYGAPVFPGAMFMLGYKGGIPIIGAPGCVMYQKASIFDLLVPRMLAGHRLTAVDIIELAHGGLCHSCPECHFPECSFGRG